MNPNDLERPTRATNAAIRRVRARLESELSPHDIQACLRALPGAPEGAEARVLRRLAAPATAEPTRHRLGWLGIGGALVGLTLVGGSAMAAVGLALAPSAPEPLEQPLAHQPVSGGGLRVLPDGDGRLSGTNENAQIDWNLGTIQLSTEHRGQIRTREASIDVASAGVEVDRGPLGTDARALHHEVTISCVAGVSRTLRAGESVVCPPVSVDGMLGRVRALSSAGASTEEILVEMEVGLNRPEGSAAGRAELGSLYAFTLANAGRDEEALVAARTWLARGHTLRRGRVERLAASLALQIEGCAGALPHLEALSLDEPTALGALQFCLGDSP